MWSYIVKRLAFMVVTLLVITMVSYTMMRLAPGDPTRANLLTGGDKAGLQAAGRGQSVATRLLREKYHLDKNPLIGYGYWLRDIVTRFDFGSSIVVDPGTPVMRLIRERMPPTIKLNVCAITLIYLISIPLGIYSSVRSRKPDERATTLVLFLLYSMPVFWVGLLLLVFFASDRFLNIFPVAGLTPEVRQIWGRSTWHIALMTARHYVLPVFCMTYGGLASLSRFARVGMLEVIRQDYIRTARAKGVPERRVILVHAFRNSLLPLITLLAGLLPSLVAGSVIVEHIFSISGMGSLSLLALNSRDYPLLMALFSMGAFLTLLGILISDICYAIVDPRISFD